jgi:hypothetical protein
MNNSTTPDRATDNNNISKIVMNTPSKVCRIYVANGGMARRKSGGVEINGIAVSLNYESNIRHIHHQTIMKYILFVIIAIFWSFDFFFGSFGLWGRDVI